MRARKYVIAFVCFAGILFLLEQSDMMRVYKAVLQNQMKVEKVFNAVELDSHDALLQKITAEAQQRSIAAIDARIDRVWKAIPGYNGREVDIEKTYHYAKQYGNNFPYFFREVPPKVTLQQLMPAPIYKGNPDKAMVSLMINVAWGDEYIPVILETLADAHVHATFFLDGSWLSKNKATAQLIQSQGHELSNHAFSHKDMSKLTRRQAVDEILKTERLLKELGVKNTLFAPPSGDYNEETVLIAHELGLKTVLWTLDTVDWKDPSPDWIVRRINTGIEPGALILMHPTKASSEALPRLIEGVKNKHLQFGTVSELLSTKRVNTVEEAGIVW